ncbi:hypothetical protein [Actinomadura rupiterrae]|nr:hypothetical protein [Actinomadura rupiterrae]MCP2338123.1 hypothetical protein [Actinomadura rupiterrae]
MTHDPSTWIPVITSACAVATAALRLATAVITRRRKRAPESVPDEPAGR